MTGIRLFGRIFPEVSSSWSVLYTLTSVLGINYVSATKICSLVGICPSLVINQLEAVHIDALDAFYLAFFSRCEREISRLQLTSLDRLVKGGNYRGIRRSQGLPTRGQRTHTNAKTAKRLLKVSMPVVHKGELLHGRALKKGRVVTKKK